jgi:ABC-type uncharacterized transport system auxiliary subunit
MPTLLRYFLAALQREIDMGSLYRFAITLIAIALFVSGCSLTSSKPPYAVQLYMVEYRLAPISGQVIGHTLRIDRFAVAQTYNNTSMLRRPDSYKLEPYNYHRWRTNPGDMTTDFIVRDFKDTGLFRAIFSYRNNEEADYVLEGNVTDFLMTKEAGQWYVLLSLDMSLIDANKVALNERVIIQKCYRELEPIEKGDPVFFAAGMSKAMAKISALMVNDVYHTIKRRSTSSQ